MISEDFGVTMTCVNRTIQKY